MTFDLVLDPCDHKVEYVESPLILGLPYTAGFLQQIYGRPVAKGRTGNIEAYSF